MLLVLVQRDLLIQAPHSAIHPHPGEAIGASPGERILEGALAVAGQRGEDLEARAGRQCSHLLHDLLRRLRAHLAPALRAVGRADAGEEHPQVVVYLGHGAHRRARVSAHRLLLDRDRRAETADEVHLRLLHLADELPGVGRERLDVAALSLGVERIECQRRLAAAGDSRDHNQFVARQRHVDVLEVVLLGPTDDNVAVDLVMVRSIAHAVC